MTLKENEHYANTQMENTINQMFTQIVEYDTIGPWNNINTLAVTITVRRL